MVGYPFAFQGREVYYAVGNPMGFYSSFVSFALAHHFVVWLAARNVGYPTGDIPYFILGDDIVIGDAAIAAEYKNIISGLGVEFSELKTHTSATLFEFAKRVVLSGTEISPFPVSAIAGSRGKYYLLLSSMMNETLKGWVPSNGISLLLGNFFREVLSWNRTRCARIHRKIAFCATVMQITVGSISANEGINSLIGQFGIPIWRPLTEAESRGVISNLIVEMFADSNPLNSKSSGGVPLGALAQDLVEKMTGEEGLFWDGVEPSMLPPLAGYGIIEEQYTRLLRKARDIDLSGGDWTEMVKSVSLPLDDRVLVTRSRELQAQGVATTGKYLESRLELLASPIGRSLLP